MSEEGEFKKRILEYDNSNGDLGVSEGLHFAIKVFEEMRRDYPNNLEKWCKENEIFCKLIENNPNCGFIINELIQSAKERWFVKWF